MTDILFILLLVTGVFLLGYSFGMSRGANIYSDELKKQYEQKKKRQ